MYILALESSAKAASAALSRDGELVHMEFQLSGLTHSRTLLPMAEEVLRKSGVSLAQVDAVAVSRGPGSFTGVRIGIATAKGLCWGAEKKAIGVSTLEAMAWNAESAGEGRLICCSMDARRNQTYNALFTFENGRPRRLCKDRAIGFPELAEELKKTDREVFVLGDGAELCYNELEKYGVKAVLAPEDIRHQNAWGVCRAAEGGEIVSADMLLPVYLRLSQAERERLARINRE